MKAMPLIAWLAPAALAQTVVLPGDDLEAIVDDAPDGEVIEIRSNEIFVGQLSWSQKSLTLVAGDGFTPTIRGEAGESAIRLAPSIPPVEAHCRGLRLISGPQDDFFSSSLEAVRMGGTGSDRSVSMVLEDCWVGGSVDVSGTSSTEANLELIGTEIVGRLIVSVTGSHISQVSMTEGSSAERLSINSTGDAAIDVILADSQFGGPSLVLAQSTSTIELEMRRCMVRDEFEIIRSSSSPLRVRMESSYFQGDGLEVGLNVQGTPTLRGVNLTVSGYEVGLETGSNSVLENLLLVGNQVDVGASVPAATVANSLISDGTFAGVNGNFTGAAQIGLDGALETGSLGLDAGNSAANGLGLFDLIGSPRIQDSDSDGVAEVNVGAHETTSQCRPASHAYFGALSGNESRYFVEADATLGGTFVGVVLPEAIDPVTLLAIGFRASSETAFPGVEGNLLLDLSTIALLDVAAGTHSLAIPANPVLCGRAFDTQALELTPAPAEPKALNGASLTIGL